MGQKYVHCVKYPMAEISSEGVYEYVLKVHDQGLLGQKKLSRSNMDYGSPEIRREGVKENVWKVQD